MSRGAENVAGKVRTETVHVRGVCTGAGTRDRQSLVDVPVEEPDPEELVPEALDDESDDVVVELEAAVDVPADDPEPAESVL